MDRDEHRFLKTDLASSASWKLPEGTRVGGTGPLPGSIAALSRSVFCGLPCSPSRAFASTDTRCKRSKPRFRHGLEIPVSLPPGKANRSRVQGLIGKN